MKNVALIPARSGSKRVINKNIRLLKNKPLIAYTIQAALNCGLYDNVIVVTDSKEYAEIALKYGAEVPDLRPEAISKDDSPDILWVKWINEILEKRQEQIYTYSILRPTSPFRSKNTFRRAFDLFSSRSDIDTLRAIQKVSEHPGKMWVKKNGNIVPLLPFSNSLDYWHNSQTNVLPLVFIQNASFEIFKSENINKFNSITGRRIVGFITEGIEGFDINTEEDFLQAQTLIEEQN